MTRSLKFFEAIQEAISLMMDQDPRVYVIGLGVPDPKGVFGTTLGLLEKYGPDRVLDMPTSENAMTGIVAGSALVGMRPILMHQRMDFAIYALDQIVNHAAKWHYMFGGKLKVPIVIRMIVGRGWGQGAQHSQSLQAWFAHIPGLKVVMPTTPQDAKGLLIASIEDNNPVIFIEHRWLHNTFGEVPGGIYRVPLGKARIAREGKDLTIVAISYMVLEALRAAEVLSQANVEAEIIDLRSLRPWDRSLIVESVQKTGRLIVADTGWRTAGFGAEIVAQVTEDVFDLLKSPPRRLGLPDCSAPTSPALSQYYYPRSQELVQAACEMLQIQAENLRPSEEKISVPSDIPDTSFTGPF